jgi:hypothetical protein
MPEQQARYEADAWAENIAEWLTLTGKARVTIGELARHALQIETSRIGTADQRPPISDYTQCCGWNTAWRQPARRVTATWAWKPSRTAKPLSGRCRRLVSRNRSSSPEFGQCPWARLFVTSTLVPSGRVRCAAVKAFGFNLSLLAVRPTL